jgi:signal transduction histidine kinase
MEVVLYRICQEALSNAAKHASASEVQVTLNITDHVLLKIEDNGKGFKVPQHPLSLVADHHFGLVTIFERVRMINGTLSIDSSPQLGTRLTIRVPPNVY